MSNQLRAEGTPYPFEVWVVLLVRDWPNEQISRVADRLQEIRGWKAGGAGPERIVYFYDAGQTTEGRVQDSAYADVSKEGVVAPMMAVFTRWRIDYLLERAPREEDRFELTRALVMLHQVSEAFFDHKTFRTVSVLVEDEPSVQTKESVRGILTEYLRA